MPEIVFFTDLHINKKVLGRKNVASGYPQRVIDIWDNLKLVVDFAIENEVNYLLFGGDAYESSKPLEEYRHMFRQEIVRAATNGIKCVLIPGNHDMTKRETADHALAEFRDLPMSNIYLVDKPQLVHFPDLTIYALPWQHNFTLPTLDLDPLKLNICMAHCTVLGATYASGQTVTTLDKDFGVDIDFFKQFNLVFLGHIHAPQVLWEDPFIGYPGSSEWLDWGEFGALHGFYYYDGTAVMHIPYKHRARYDYDWSTLDEFSSVLPQVNTEAMYRVKVKDVHTDIIIKHFGSSFDLTVTPVITRLRDRPQYIDIKPGMTKKEILIQYMAEQWDSEIEILFDVINDDVEKNR